MKKVLTFMIVLTLAIFLGSGLALAGEKPPPGKHYNLNIIGFAQCKKTSDVDPDCFNGNAGDIVTSGHTLFVPIETQWVEDPCTTNGDSGYADPTDIQVADLAKGVRILVTDADDMMIIDRDATDGLGRFGLPNGCYDIYARALGKPGGCMDIDTIICYDDVNGVPVQVDCDPGLNNDQFVAVGHLDVDRTTNGSNKPHWQHATGELLPAEVGLANNDYFDFFWQLFNNKLRLLQLRIYEVECQ